MIKLIIKTFLFIFVSSLFLGVNYSDFNIVSDTNNIILSWHTMQEGNLSETIVTRRTHNGIYSEIARIKAKGDNSTYTYTDENAFKIEDGVYTYQLKFKDSNGNISKSIERNVTHLTSVEKRTWGSIKALFR